MANRVSYYNDDDEYLCIQKGDSGWFWYIFGRGEEVDRNCEGPWNACIQFIEWFGLGRFLQKLQKKSTCGQHLKRA